MFCLQAIIFRFAKIQCALFKGNDRDEFLDKKEYSGPLYEQIEEAYRFVLRHINRSAEINGLLRKERYELPVGAIREMIINAQCHLSFMDSSCVQVALFDDRLEDVYKRQVSACINGVRIRMVIVVTMGNIIVPA